MVLHCLLQRGIRIDALEIAAGLGLIATSTGEFETKLKLEQPTTEAFELGIGFLKRSPSDRR